MQAVTEKTSTADIPTIEDRIAALPENQAQRLNALKALLKEQEALLEEQEGNVKAVTDEIIRVARSAIEKNMNPDERVLAGISDRYALSSEYGVSREDFDTAFGEIRTNEKALTQLRRLKATGAEMTMTTVNASEIVFIDSVDNVDVKAQETFLSALDEQERAGAVGNLKMRFPDIEQYLQRADGARGLNYYDYLVVCEITGAEPMSEDEYRALQKKKPVDRQTICWLLTKQEMLDRGGALRGDRCDREVRVDERGAGYRRDFRAGRPRLRVQRT